MQILGFREIYSIYCIKCLTDTPPQGGQNKSKVFFCRESTMLPRRRAPSHRSGMFDFQREASDV